MEKININSLDIKKHLSCNTPAKDKYKFIGFTMIPNQILMDKTLSRSCLVVFWALTLHLFRKNKNRYVFPSLNTIAKESHCAKGTVIRAIRQLEAKGYIEIERDNGHNGGRKHNNKYYLNVIV